MAVRGDSRSKFEGFHSAAVRLGHCARELASERSRQGGSPDLDRRCEQVYTEFDEVLFILSTKASGGKRYRALLNQVRNIRDKEFPTPRRHHPGSGRRPWPNERKRLGIGRPRSPQSAPRTCPTAALTQVADYSQTAWPGQDRRCPPTPAFARSAVACRRTGNAHSRSAYAHPRRRNSPVPILSLDRLTDDVALTPTPRRSRCLVDVGR